MISLPTNLVPLLLAVGFGVPGLAAAGVLLMSIPIIIHFLNRRRFKVHQWAAMQYLLEAMRRNRRRLQFEHWLLMMIRCCAILLAGLALARPLGCSGNSAAAVFGQGGRLNVIVIDNTASMAWQRLQGDAHTNFERARELSGELLARWAKSHDAACLIATAGETGAVAQTPTYDIQAVRQALDQLPQRFTAGDLGTALRQALTIARDGGPFPGRRLYILSDSTVPAWQSEAVANELHKLGPELAQVYDVVHIDVGENQMPNSTVESVRVLGGLATTAMGVDLAAQPRAYGQGGGTLIWQRGARVLGTSARLTIDASAPEQILPQVRFDTDGPESLTVRLDPGDRLPEDDAFSLALNVRKRLNVVIAEGERGSSALDSPGTMLQMALSPGQEGGADAGLSRVDLIAETELAGRVLSDTDAILLAAPSRVMQSEAAQLRGYVEAGGTLVIFLGEGINAEQCNQTLLAEKLLPGKILSLTTAAEGQEPFRFDFRPDAALHPLLRAFREQENSGLATARIFTYGRVQLDAAQQAQRVLDLSNGDPAITIHHLGTGKVVFFATSADTRWTTLPAKPAFVALLNEILLGTIDADNGWMNIAAGSRLEVPRRIAQTVMPRLTDPQGHLLSLEPAGADHPTTAYVSTSLEMPGLYRLQIDGKSYPIAVRFPASESNLTHLDPAAIRRALGDITMEQEADRLPAEFANSRDQADFGWPLLLAVLILAGTECFLAMWFRRG